MEGRELIHGGKELVHGDRSQSLEGCEFAHGSRELVVDTPQILSQE